MRDRDSSYEKVLMGVPIGIAAAAVAYGGGHWMLVGMLGLVGVLVTSSAALDAWKAGAHVSAGLGLTLVVLPVGFAGFVVADRDSGRAAVAARQAEKAVGLEWTTGVMRDGAKTTPSGGAETDLLSFAEVADLLRTARRSESAAVQSPEERYAVNRLRAWEALGVRQYTAVDPATGKPILSSSRRESLAKAKRSFEDKIAAGGRQAMLTHEEAAWAVFTLASQP